METEYNEDFSGVYYFTNPTNVPRTFLWNNKEYTFAPESRSPIIIPTETLENIQEIRKRWALTLAKARLYEGERLPGGYEYNKAKDMGNGMPPTFDEKILEPFITECLKPLPMGKTKVTSGKNIDDERNYKATKAMDEGDNPAFIFAEENKNPPKLGAMPDR